MRKGAELLNPKIMNCKSDFEQLIIPRCPAPGGEELWVARESNQFAIFHSRTTAATAAGWVPPFFILCTVVYNSDL